MQIALLHNHYQDSHLEQVMHEMAVLGSPTINAVWMECHGIWAALEGCHRIRAAAALGIEVNIDPVEYSDDPLSTLGVTDIDYDYPISECADEAYSKVIIEITE